MTQPVQEPTPERRAAAEHWRIRQLARRPGIASGVPGPWQTPTLVNDYMQPVDPFEQCQFRLGPNELHLEFKGHLDVAQATPNTVAFTLPSGWRLSELGHEDQFFATFVLVEPEDPASTSVEDQYVTLDCVVYIEAVSGDVILIWDQTEGDDGGGSAECCDEIQAALDAHIADDTDAHDAEAISVEDSGGNFAATNVEDALTELFGLAGTGGGGPYAKLWDEKGATTDGGTFTAGAWQTRELNQEYDPDGFVTLASNQFDLPAGTYRVRARAPALQVAQHQAKLVNVDDTVDVLIGAQSFSATAAAQAQTDSVVCGEFTIAATKTFEIQHRCITTKATNGFGTQPGAFAAASIYTEVELWKVA